MSDKKRVMWLLNHTSARKFEVPMLKECGFDEVFLPKSFPADPNFRSASVDWSEDQYLTIPERDLKILNETDWYQGGDKNAWEIANKWFDAVFFIVYDEKVIKNIAFYFQGISIWRAYGLDKSTSYTAVLSLVTEGKGSGYIRRMGKRFYLGIAYEHLANIESPYLKERALYLPLGMKNTQVNNIWVGDRDNILFVCPDIAINTYYNAIYKKFITDFSEFNYLISGAQPIRVMDKNVLGFVSAEEHDDNMKRSKVMYYHSDETHHIHYHPFEAIRCGLPLIFMAGGMLDRLGGINLPGRCNNIKEAKDKIKRIMSGDRDLIDSVRQSQGALLSSMSYDNLKPLWVNNLSKLTVKRETALVNPGEYYSKKKVAVILPVGYLGGSLRGALLLANAIRKGSLSLNEACQVIFYHQDDPIYKREMFSELDKGVSIRSFSWKKIGVDEAKRAMVYAGYEEWDFDSDEYVIPDDGINYGFDCDLWLVISDRIEAPILPVKPTVIMVYDYLQRRNNFLESSRNDIFIDVVRRADKVMVTTNFTMQDALNYAGIKKERIVKVPMLIPDFSEGPQDDFQGEIIGAAKIQEDIESERYFIWTTNTNPHKHFEKVVEALRLYYEVYEGELQCYITGVNTDKLLHNDIPAIDSARKQFASSKKLKRNIKFKGNLSDAEYKMVLSSSNFLLHSSHGDNGTFSVVEAAYLNVPSLCNKYPAIEEMNKDFQLNLTFFDVFNVHEMAKKIKLMEMNYKSAKSLLPTIESLNGKLREGDLAVYWKEIRGLL